MSQEEKKEVVNDSALENQEVEASSKNDVSDETSKVDESSIENEVKEEVNDDSLKTVEEELIKEEVQEEIVVEEAKNTDSKNDKEKPVVKEEKKEDSNSSFESDIQFFELEPITDPDEAVRLINESRVSFTEFHKKTMKNSKLLQIIFLIVVAGAIFVASFYPAMLTITIALVSVYFIMMFFQTRRTRNKMNEIVEEYIVRYGLLIDSYVYGNNYMLKDVRLAYKYKIEMDEVIKNDIYKDVLKTQSRDYIKGKVLGVNFYCSDVSFKTGTSPKDKNCKVPAVGKMYKFNLKLKNEGKIVIYLSKTKEGKPTNLDGLEEVKVKNLDERFEVYASSQEITKVITSSLANVLSSFEINDDLVDLVINISDKATYVLLSYSDKIMVIPYEKPYEKESLLQYHTDAMNVVSIVNSLVNSKKMSKF